MTDVSSVDRRTHSFVFIKQAKTTGFNWAFVYVFDELAAYIGSGDVFPQAIAEFAVLYAEQNQLDCEALQQAVVDGRIEASLGV